MKSIMEEASSVAKAIEKGWAKAGHPKEFSVKVFEQPEKNFFGMTIKNAKIALLFEEQPDRVKQEPTKQRPKQKKAPVQRQPESRQHHAKTGPMDENLVWTAEMVSFASTWLKTALASIHRNVRFNTEVENEQLFILFESPLASSEEQSRRLTRPLSQLMVQTLRNHFKKPLRGYKVIMKVANT